MKILILHCSILFATSILNGQKIAQEIPSEESTTKTKKSIIPIIFFLPETSLAFGATLINTVTNTEHSEGTRPSQYLLSAAYTLKNQLLLFAPYELYSNNNLNRIKGELGYYRFFYNYHGLGRTSLVENLETYNVIFPRIDVNFSRQFFQNTYLGVGINFDAFNITEITTGGLLMTDQPTGYDGGNKSNIYFLAAYDTRDHINAPSKGYYIEASVQQSLFSPISDFSYNKYIADFRKYITVGEQKIIATQFFFATATEGTPFFDLPYISTPMLGRGLNDRRYINHTIVSTQVEYRTHLWKRFYGAAFVGVNSVPDTRWDLLQDPIYTYGVGLRYEIQQESKTKLRVDIAAGDGSFNFYFTVNEGF